MSIDNHAMFLQVDVKRGPEGGTRKAGSGKRGPESGARKTGPESGDGKRGRKAGKESEDGKRDLEHTCF